MLTVEMLPAGHGDCLVVEYGATRSTTHRVLIDAGTIHSWDAVRTRLLAMPNVAYEAFVVTHVDEDHIGGALKLLVDPDLRHRITDVWFNGFIHCQKGGSVLGPVDGERLTALIRNGGFGWNRPFPHPVGGVGGPVVVPATGPPPRIPLPGGAVIHLLSPNPTVLKTLATEWEKIVVLVGIVPGSGTPLEAKMPPKRHKVVAPLRDPLKRPELVKMAAASPPDPSKANASSIAFVLEFNNKRALVTGDATGGVLLPALRRLGESLGEDKVRLDLFKLPHHGSRANVSTELIEAVDVANYLISSNGDNYGHPDNATMARILLASARPPTFFCNYNTDRTLPWKQAVEAFDGTMVLPKEGKSGLRASVGT